MYIDEFVWSATWCTMMFKIVAEAARSMNQLWSLKRSWKSQHGRSLLESNVSSFQTSAWWIALSHQEELRRLSRREVSWALSDVPSAMSRPIWLKSAPTDWEAFGNQAKTSWKHQCKTLHSQWHRWNASRWKQPDRKGVKKLFSSLNSKPKKLWTCWDGKVALPLALNIRDRSRLLREEGKAFSSLMRS